MAYLTPDTVTRIKARITAKQVALDALYAAQLEGATTVKEYRFDSGDGSQRVVQLSPKEINDQISILEAQIDHLYRKLDGTGIVNMSLRRKG